MSSIRPVVDGVIAIMDLLTLWYGHKVTGKGRENKTDAVEAAADAY